MDLWEIAEYVGETLVFIGVVGEVYADWGERAHKKLEKASSLLLIIGLAISLAALVGTNENFNSTIATLRVQSAFLEKTAGEANERAGAAQKEAARLRLLAEELEEKNLEQGSRELLLYGKRGDDFINSIRAYEGQKVEIRRCMFNDNEVLDTARRLVVIFREAGWNVSPGSPDWGESNCAFTKPNTPSPSGLWVGIPNTKPTPRTKGRAKELIEDLNKVPLAATPHIVQADTGRASPSRLTILETYGDSDALVVIVLAHPSKITGRTSSQAPQQHTP